MYSAFNGRDMEAVLALLHRLGVEVRQLVRDRDGKVLFDGVVRHVYRFRDGLVLDMRIESI